MARSKYSSRRKLAWIGATLGLATAASIYPIPAAQAVAPGIPSGCATSGPASFPNTTPVPIATGPAVVTSTIAVAGLDPVLHDVDVVTNLQHTNSADLDVTLASPAGTVVTLTTDNGSSLDNVFAGTTWDDDADPNGQVPYTTNPGLAQDHPYVNLTAATPLAPEEALASFMGEDPNGTWTLTISDDLAANGGTLQSWSLSITALEQATVNVSEPVVTNSIPVPIPATAPPIVLSSTLVVAGAGTYLQDVDVFTNLQHTFSADLDVTLASPAGTVVTLTSDNGGDRDNVFAGTTWDDDANPAGQVPYVTNNGLATDHTYVNLTVATPLAPEEALGAFIGEDPNGTWTLTISDDLNVDGGTLQSWSVQVDTSSDCVDPPPPPPPDVTVDGAQAKAAKNQKFSGKSFKVKSTVSADVEALTATVTGKVKIKSGGGNRVIAKKAKSYSLKKLVKSVAVGQTVKLKQGIKGSKSKVAKAKEKIAAALAGGGKVTVKLKFKFTDAEGNVQTIKRTVKIKAPKKH